MLTPNDPEGSLKSELRFLKGIANHRLRGLYLHLIVESYVNRIIKKYFRHPKKFYDERTSFSTKIRVLRGLDIISEDLFHNLKIVSKMRNLYAHKIWVEGREIEEMLRKIRFSKKPLLLTQDVDLDGVKRSLMESAFKEIGGELNKVLKKAISAR